MLDSTAARWAPLLLCIAFGIIYWQFPAINWTYADDGQRWALSLTSESGVINSHHLIFNILREAFQILQYYDVNIRADEFLTRYASVFGVLGIGFLILVCREIGLQNVSLICALLCGVSTGYWSYSIVGDVYVPTIACLMGAVFFMLRGLRIEGKEKWLYGFCSAALSIVALLHHQAFFIFVFGIGLQGLFFNKGGPVVSKQLYFSMSVTLAAGVCCLLIYVAIYFAQRSGADQTIVGFMSGYAQNFVAYPDMKGFSLMSLVKAGAGFTRALISTNILFQYDAFAASVQQMFPYRHMHTAVYVGRQMTSVQAAMVWMAFGSTLFLGLLLSLRGLLALKFFPSLVKLFGYAVLPQMLFFIWWESISDEFWIWTMPLWALLVAAGIIKGEKKWRVMGLVLVIFLFTASLVGTVLPYGDEASDIDWVNLKFVEDLNANDMLVSLDEIVISNRIRRIQKEKGFEYFSMFTNAAKGNDLQIKLILQTAERVIAAGGKVYIGPYLLQAPLSYLQLIKLNTTKFEQKRDVVISGLRELGINNVHLIYPDVVMPEYFDSPVIFK
ncbi:MAG: hypothetical protein KUG79_11755 [Pseudomonadales bacterium]|nr:hypothetical protein [Pseudomonadales bacterium]